MRSSPIKLWQFLLATTLCNLVGYAWGYGDGEKRGYARAVAEHIMRKDEHDDIMRKIGVCKWATIMAEDIRCKSELP